MLDFNTDERSLTYRFARLAPPDDAIACAAWQWHGGEDWRRPFLIKERQVGGIWVSVVGEQNHHGKVTRWVHVGGEDRISRADGRRLIAALIDAEHVRDAASIQSCAVN